MQKIDSYGKFVGFGATTAQKRDTVLTYISYNGDHVAEMGCR